MLTTHIATVFRLGPVNVATVLLYKLAIRARLFEKLLPIGQGYQDALFNLTPATAGHGVINDMSKTVTLQDAEAFRSGRTRLFSNRFFQVGSPPNWFVNPVNGRWLSHPDVHWARVPDFGLEIGDLKGLWELSRFDWALLLARAYRLTGDPRYVTLLNAWVSDWIAQNPLNRGPNWKCGQETAIRMMQVLLTAFILNQHRTPTPGLQRFVIEHCSRIAPTIRYAMAQNNNHGTSEAAGLYIGGAWLTVCCPDDRLIKEKALKWQRSGTRWLENRVRKLIAPDGSFSQYSLNYHRVVLDTLNMVEFWRRELGLPAFSDFFYERAQAAVHWLYQMIDPDTGDAPNFGANDGARLFVLSSTAYRDYRPSIQIGSVLFFGEKIYSAGAWDEPLLWLGLDERPTPNPSQEGNRLLHGQKNTIKKDGESSTSGSPLRFNRKSCIMPDGGYVLMYFPFAQAVIRFPNFRFRPAHADAFHLDLRYNGINLLRGSGSYSYNAEEPWQNYFSGTAAHNTVEFDGRSQMPKISRFLFGSWLKMESVGELTEQNGWLSWTGSYQDDQGCRHRRTVTSNGFRWKIIDNLAGFHTKAVLRYRLAPGQWIVKGTTCISEMAVLTVNSSVQTVRCELVEGWESHYYLEKTGLPVFEIEVNPDHAILTTEIHLKG